MIRYPIFTSSLSTIVFMVWSCVSMATEMPFKPDPKQVERGRYVSIVNGCNDCHTSGYIPNEGNVPESQWLTGDPFGWSGPWGTTYASNLRLYFSNLTEEDWVTAARNLRRRPPMPWFNLKIMEESDLRALYHFVRSLGEPGIPAPGYLPPGTKPVGPHALFVLNP